jgi:hypothetical protein
MTRALEPSRARLKRARDNIAVLAQEMTAMAANSHATIDIAAQLRNPELRRPRQICILVGEIIYNLRAALDHLIWALAVRNGQNVTSRLAFPICESIEHFKLVSQSGSLKGVPRKFYPVIASAQPYLAPEPANSVLKVLEDLAIADAHDGIAVTFTRDPDGDGYAFTIDAVGAYDDASVLPVLEYLSRGVDSIVESFGKCF